MPYNGSMASWQFGPVSAARVRRWLRDGHFDVVHLHEPGTFSLSSLALFEADVPIVATFHTSTERSRATWCSPGRSTRSWRRSRRASRCRRWRGGCRSSTWAATRSRSPTACDVRLFAAGPLLPGYPRDGLTVGFLGRYDEPRKGMAVLLDAVRTAGAG